VHFVGLFFVFIIENARSKKTKQNILTNEPVPCSLLVTEEQ